MESVFELLRPMSLSAIIVAKKETKNSKILEDKRQFGEIYYDIPVYNSELPNNKLHLYGTRLRR